MMTSTRPRDVGGSFASRRGHGSQLSISDPSHHVTEAIGTMYGDDEDSGAEDARPLSFIASKYDQLEKAQKSDHPGDDRLRLVRTTSDQTSLATLGPGQPNGINGGLKKAQTFPARVASDAPKSPLAPPSPTPPLRDAPSAATSQFPLTNIDNPSDIAQELSNLQALRRMSMDVGNTTDPDLLAFSGVSLMAIPPIAPTGDDDEADPSRLLWVPARVHPELEPTAFKNFLENRVQSMKRRSGESFLSADGLQRNNSGSLRRKKSMLSRQINTSSEGGDGYVDGAEKLARQRSSSEHSTPELSLSELVNDPTKAVQKLAQETMSESGEGDSPILPVAPGMGLRRSTKTTYRKGGSQRFGDRVPFSKRVAGRQAEKESSEEPPPVPAIDPSIGKPLMRVNSEPIAENYSRPTRTVRRQQNFSRESPSTLDGPGQDDSGSSANPPSPPSTLSLPVRSSSTSAVHTPVTPVPQIIETPPAEESSHSQPARSFPERSSSQKTSQPANAEKAPLDGPPARSSKRPAASKPVQPSAPASAPARHTSLKEQVPQNENALGEISHPLALPGSGASTTSSLTFIPTFDTIERKVDKRGKEKDDNDSVVSYKSTSSWKWFKSDDKEKKRKEKEKEREKEREREEQSKKAKSKAGEKSHDSARLDVLQSSIDNVKGRESLRLDRDSIEIPHDERKKETNRKSSDSKKEREGFFGGLFGGSKKKGDKDSSHKKKEHRPLSPEPPRRQLRPDIDYPWTRFQIIEERAIYRMAHIKLANPRRSLHSQVLLSNFMYSYLAKVQAMHPGLQVPISPQQKRLEEERKRREAEQAQLQMEQQMAEQAAQDGTFDFEYHRSGNQYGDAPVQHDGSVQYVDDAQIYEYEHGSGGDQHQHQHYQQNDAGGRGYHAQDGYGPDHQAQGQVLPQGHARQGSAGGGAGGRVQQQQSYYYGRGDTKQFDDDDDDSDMW